MNLFKKLVRNPGRHDLDSLVRGNTAFALALYRELGREEGNLFFSPHSLSTALAMTFAGARGTTEAQVAGTLHFTLEQQRLHPAFASLEAKLKEVQGNGRVLLQAANALWPQAGYSLLEEYLALAKECYGVSVTPVDYGDPGAAAREINAWVSEATRGKITDLVPPGTINALTRLILTNAIYFKGSWAGRFDPELTKPAPFLPTPSTQVEVPMMTREQACGYWEGDGLQVLELPYLGGNLSMVILLPGAAGGLPKLEPYLSPEILADWLGYLRETKVRLFLPRFQVSRGFMLNNVLASMGMPDAFDLEKADFSGIDGREHWLYLAAVLHKAFVEVNEEGTEAAASTAAVMQARSFSPPPPTFRADHPFIFLIRENDTGSILFLGRVVNPAGG